MTIGSVTPGNLAMLMDRKSPLKLILPESTLASSHSNIALHFGGGLGCFILFAPDEPRDRADDGHGADRNGNQRGEHGADDHGALRGEPPFGTLARRRVNRRGGI